MPIRVVEIPDTVELQSPVTGVGPGPTPAPVKYPFPFSKFVDTLLSHPQWITSHKMVRAAAELEKVFAGAQGSVELAEEDWEHLVASIRNPKHTGDHGESAGFGLRPWVMRRLLPYLDAIAGAEQKEHKAVSDIAIAVGT